MNPDNFISRALKGDFTSSTKSAIGFIGTTILCAIILPNRSGELENYFLRWFFQIKGLAILLLAGLIGYFVGNLWTTEDTGKKTFAIILTSAYIILLGIGYWYINFHQ